MSDHPTDPVIDFMRVQFGRLNARLDRSDDKIAEVIQRVGGLEVGQAGIRRDLASVNETMAHMSVRLDGVSGRIDRIERRLDLAEAG